jgi:hypothetical protein
MRRSLPVLFLSMVTGQMFTTGSDEWGIVNAECGVGQEVGNSNFFRIPHSAFRIHRRFMRELLR